MELFWKGAPACSCALAQLTYMGMDQIVCVYKCQFGKCSFSFPPCFKYFLHLDPLVTSEPGAFQSLLKKYLLFLGEIYFKDLENSLYLLVQFALAFKLRWNKWWVQCNNRSGTSREELKEGLYMIATNGGK